MKKELIIIVYKINVQGLTRHQSEQHIQQIIHDFTLNFDEELKDDYIIREIYLPIHNNETSDVKVIYPISPKISEITYIQSPEINELVSEISKAIKNDPTNSLSIQWKKLVRELKLRKIEEESEC